MVDLSSIINYLSAISSIVVILGAIFVVFQLRRSSSKLLMERFHLNVNPRGSFEWLAEETRKHMTQRQAGTTKSLAP